jgi:hypothetical protein
VTVAMTIAFKASQRPGSCAMNRKDGEKHREEYERRKGCQPKLLRRSVETGKAGSAAQLPG